MSPTCSSASPIPADAVAPQAGQRVEVLPSRQRRVQTRPVHETRNPVRKSERPAHAGAEDLQVSAVGLRQSEQETEQRGLPSPVRSDQTVHLALRDVEIDTVEGDDLAKGLADPARPHGERFVSPILGWWLRRPGRLGLGKR